MNGCWSLNVLFTVAPRLTGADQGSRGDLARGDPKVSEAERAQTVRVQEQLQTIERYARALFVQWAAELRQQDGRSLGSGFQTKSRHAVKRDG